MLRIALSVLALGAFGLSSVDSDAPAPDSAPASPSAEHCQVPCGIYGDSMRIDMLMEDAATIAKAMQQIRELDPMASAQNRNQLVRWVTTKEEHAQSIQDTVAKYWLAQRVKAPKEGAGSMDKYHKQLVAMHGITVAAMKCKQTVDTGNVDRMKQLAMDFATGYFSEEDLKHIKAHHGGHGH